MKREKIIKVKSKYNRIFENQKKNNIFIFYLHKDLLLINFEDLKKKQ